MCSNTTNNVLRRCCLLQFVVGKRLIIVVARRTAISGARVSQVLDLIFGLTWGGWSCRAESAQRVRDIC